MWQLPRMSPEEILLYSRKSRTDDPTMTVEEVLSKHEQMLDEWVERNLPGQGRIPEGNRYREVVSGETIESRPAVREVLRRMESPAIKAVLIVEPHRLSRGDLEDIGRLVKLLRYTETLVITLQYNYDMNDDRDRDQFERELKRGNEILEYFKTIQQNGRLLAVKNGYFIGQHAPYGYRKIVYREGKKKCHTLEPDPETAPVVRKIFEMYRDGFGSRHIARELNAMGIKTALGRDWSPYSLHPMRNNEHYLGKVVWNRRKEVRRVEDGEITVSRPLASEYMVYPGKHPAIIDQELWDAAHKNMITRATVSKKPANPLAGLIYCQCGRSMTLRTYKNKEGRERAKPRLLCEGQTTCHTPSCSYYEMLNTVIGILKEAIADFELKIKMGDDGQEALHQSLIEKHENRLAELDKLEVAQWDEKIQGVIPQHVFDSLNQKLLDERDEVRQALSTLRATAQTPIDYTKKKALFSDALDLLLDPDASVRSKNRMLQQCIARISYKREPKQSNNPRWGDPEPMELDVHLRV